MAHYVQVFRQSIMRWIVDRAILGVCGKEKKKARNHASHFLVGAGDGYGRGKWDDPPVIDTEGDRDGGCAP